MDRAITFLGSASIIAHVLARSIVRVLVHISIEVNSGDLDRNG